MKKLFKYILLILVLTLLASCGNDKDIPKENNTNKIKQEETKELEEIKENQEEKNTKISDKKLEKQLKEYRLEREENTEVTKGNHYIVKGISVEVDGEEELREYIPSIEKNAEEGFKIDKLIENYITEQLKVESNTKSIYYSCIDPRINKLYKPGEDKGKLSNYENENIAIYEYLDGDEWKYIFLGRDSKNGDWKVVHTGSSYK